MAASEGVKQQDVRRLLHLVHELHELAPPGAARTRQLVEGACRIINGSCGSVSRVHIPASRQQIPKILELEGFGWGADAIRQMLAYQADHGVVNPALVAIKKHLRSAGADPVTRCRTDLIDDQQWYASAYVQELRRPLGVDDLVLSLLPIGEGLYWNLCINRPWGHRQRFTERDRQLLDLLHAEARWVYRSNGAPGADPVLPLRWRQTLEYLLAGDSEKQVAARLGLSRHTVHNYVKSIYRRYKVSSRSELLAKLLPQRP